VTVTASPNVRCRNILVALKYCGIWCFDGVEFAWTLVQTRRVLVCACYLISWRWPELNVAYLVKVGVLRTGSKHGFLRCFVFPWSYERMPVISNLQITGS